MAARQGAKVVAVDVDHDSVDVLYRSIAGAKGADAGIQPIWTSFMNPTPAMGFANRERRSFLSRHRAEAVLALALIHHLHVSERLPLPLLAREFAGFTSKWLIIEYVDPADPMFRSLPAFREDLYRGLTEEAFLQAFQPYFTFEEMTRLPGGLRILFAMRKKD
jgi:hypothetical protein